MNGIDSKRASLLANFSRGSMKKAIELSLKKDELEKELNYLYTGEESKILIDEKMKKINEIQKELYSLESVKRYMELRMKLKEVLSVLEQGILRSVK